MSYTINKTDGSVLTEVVDGTVDQTATDLTLVGKNATSYGEFFNENFVHMLENFANTSQPNHPVTGQLWFDTTEGRLKVYDGNGFKVSGGTIVSNTVPGSITQGDIWIDSTTQQLYFNDGVSTILAGPGYTAQQGLSGYRVFDIVDTNAINHTVVGLYVAQTLIGIWSKDFFTPATPISGYTGNVEIGFNSSSFGGIKMHATATIAEKLLDSLGVERSAESFLSTTDDSQTTGTLTIQNATPLVIGPGLTGSAEFKISDYLFRINSNISGQDFAINSLNSSGLLSSLYIDATNQWVGIYNSTPTVTLDVGGDVRVQGDLVVEGSLTTINTFEVNIEEKLISLGKTPTPSNTTAQLGGILLEAGLDGDKTLLWDTGVGSEGAWVSSESFNIAAGKNYYINELPVIVSEDSSTFSLGPRVQSAPGLTSIGNLDVLHIANLKFGDTGTENVIAFDAVATNGDIVLVPKGTGSVNVSNAKIINLSDIDPLTADGTDASNKNYVDYAVSNAPLAISLDTTGLNDAGIASTYLQYVFPWGEHAENTICRVVATDTGVTTIKEFRLESNVWTIQA